MKSFVINNGKLLIGGASPLPDAVLALQSTTQGFLPPAMNTSERDAIPSPSTGLQIFNTTSGQMEVFDGAVWTAMGGSSPSGIEDGGNAFGSDITIGTNDAYSLYFETGGVSRIKLDTSGHLLFTTDATYNIGQISDFRPNIIYIANKMAVGQHTTELADVSTTDATPTLLYTAAIDDDSVYIIEVLVSARRTDSPDRAVFRKNIAVYREAAGSATVITPGESTLFETDSTWTVDLGVSGNNVTVTVTGESAANINWQSTITHQRVS